MTAAAVLEVKDALPAISLVFTVLAFFAGRRIDAFDAKELGSGQTDLLHAVIDLALALSAAAIIWITWPLARAEQVFGDVGEADDVLPNLLGAVLIGIALICLTQCVLAVLRLIPFFRNNLKASLSVLTLMCVAAALILL